MLSRHNSQTSFSYVARDASGELIKGIVNSNSCEEAGQDLKLKGLYISKIRKLSFIEKWFISSKKVPPAELALFFKNMELVLKSGVSLTKGLKVLSHSASKSLKPLIDEVLATCESGLPVSSALEESDKQINSTIISLIRTGEKRGRLDDAFRISSELIEKDQALISLAKNIVRYPLIILSAGFVAFIIATFVLLPKFSNIYMNSSLELPLITKIMFAVGLTLQSNIFSILIIAIILLHRKSVKIERSIYLRRAYRLDSIDPIIKIGKIVIN
ncbi:MAG: type II secretion system F family protein [Nitrospinota bacterium]